MQSSEPTPINDKWRLALANYLVRLSEQIKALEIFSESHCAGALSDEDREKLTMDFHRLAGSGGTYGFAELSENAKELELSLGGQAPIACGPLSQAIAKFCRDGKAAVRQKKISDTTASPAASGEATSTDTASLPLIVAVDDDPTIRQAIDALLGAEARLLFGENTVEAETLMRTHNPALVLMDDIMPNGLTGLKFLEKIKDDPTLSKIPLIMITASDGKDDVLRGLTAGACDYVTKPFNPEKLRETIRGRLTRQHIHIFLKLKNRALVAKLAERLRQLRCLVTTPEDEGADDWGVIGASNAILVCDHASLSPEAAAAQSAAYPTCRFLLLAKDGDAVATNANASVATMRDTDDADAIVRRLGSILAAQKRK